MQFASTINNFATANQPVVFLIGAPFSHSEEVLAKAKFTLSLSNLIFVHFLVRLIYSAAACDSSTAENPAESINHTIYQPLPDEMLLAE